MYNCQKNRNFRKYKNGEDGTFKYVITVDGEKVEVSEEIYKVYAKYGYKMENMEYNAKCDRVQQDSNGNALRDENGNVLKLEEREISLDKLIDENWDYPSSEPLPEEILIEQLEIKVLHECLDLLDADERELINALYFKGLTIRKYAEITGKTKSSADRSKTKILAKLKKLLEF